MASIQERLQMKRVPLDTWNTREQLCLASSVVRSGDQNWMSVSRALKALGDPNRPADWFSQKSCAAQYGSLLEHVETPKRKKRTADGAAETPQESILKKLTQERITELQKLMSDASHTYNKIKDEVKELMSPSISDARVRSLALAVEAERTSRCREAARRAQWLKEREDRRLLLERAWRRPSHEPPAPHASPLLTSLLQSPTTPHATDLGNATIGAPTLSHLLEKSPATAHSSHEETTSYQTMTQDSKQVLKSEQQKIEQIKSELLQEIEQQFTVGDIRGESDIHGAPQTMHNSQLLPIKDPPSVNIIKNTEKIDIDDIEIKAEDVYAFSDIDLDIPPVSSIHKSSLSRTLHSDKNLFNKRESTSNVPVMEEISPSPCAPDSSEVLSALLSPLTPLETQTSGVVNEGQESEQGEETQSQVNPNENIESNSAEENFTEMETLSESVNYDKDNVSNNEESKHEVAQASNTGDEESDGEMNQKVSDIRKDIQAKKSTENLSDIVESSGENTQEAMADIKVENSDDFSTEDNDNMEAPNTGSEETAATSQGDQPSETNIETDDDTPIQVSKVDKPGKMKRDYSRKKTEKDERSGSPHGEITMEASGEGGKGSSKSEYSDEVGSDNSQGSADKKILNRRFKTELSGSRSESPSTPQDSLPGSPAPSTPPPAPTTPASTQEKEYRIWKKSILLAYNRLNTLRYASLFMRPITDEQAPNYSLAVKRPMDLSTIRRNIDTGVIKTTADFQRDVLLMLSNALMYNRSDHHVYEMACDTIRDALGQLAVLLQAQGACPLPETAPRGDSRAPRPAKRPPLPPGAKRKRGISDTPGGKKRKVEETV